MKPEHSGQVVFDRIAVQDAAAEHGARTQVPLAHVGIEPHAQKSGKVDNDRGDQEKSQASIHHPASARGCPRSGNRCGSEKREQSRHQSVILPPWALMLLWAASRMRTTRSPA